MTPTLILPPCHDEVLPLYLHDSFCVTGIALTLNMPTLLYMLAFPKLPYILLCDCHGSRAHCATSRCMPAVPEMTCLFLYYWHGLHPYYITSEIHADTTDMFPSMCLTWLLNLSIYVICHNLTIYVIYASCTSTAILPYIGPTY